MERFICDEMLGTLAKWLRILGFDTEYAKGMEDTDILNNAAKDGWILLTRDRELHRRAGERGIESLYLGNASLEEDLKAVLEEYPPQPERFMTRCTLCNSELIEVEKESVRGKVPEGVYERQELFWYCANCGKYYWKGSHWNKMREFLLSLK